MARPSWRLLVEGLGRIERAEVQVRPLMLFVGDNNSGKSYLATLMWGLLALQAELGPPPKGPILEECERWFARKLVEHPNEAEFSLTDEDRALFVKLFDETLSATQQRFVSRVFNNKLVGVSHIAFSNASPGRDVRVALRHDSDTDHTHAAVLNGGYSGLGSSDRGSLLLHIARRLVFGALANSWAYGERQHGNSSPLFLPAARTGFMLLYKAVVSRQLQQLEMVDLDPLRVNLTLPAIRFLNLLALGLTDTAGPYAEEAAFLEEPLRGRVALAAGGGGVGVNEYYYRPEGSDARLDMSLSSSLVTELAPVILVLRHLGDFPVLILEEPEAHLHPSVQRKLAQVIVRLIRKGLYVWITTHSENLCQQINNFLKIGSDRDRAGAQKALGYDEQDYLELDDVTGYEFVVQGDKSIVRELKRYEDGMVMPTFNRPLLDLSKEIDFLDRRVEDGK